MRIERRLPVIDLFAPSGDFHRRVHLKNQAALKHEAKIEKEIRLEMQLEKVTHDIAEQRKTDKAVAERYQLLNVI